MRQTIPQSGRADAASLEGFTRRSLADYLAQPDNLHRQEGNIVHIEMVTLWEDLDAIRRFAGDELTKAKYYDFDPDFLIEMEPEVTHFEVVD